MTRHLLVTNDFPPKHGGIQSYLWELWRRLDPSEVVVLTTPHPGDRDFDAEQPFEVVRDSARVLLPSPALTRRIDDLADEVGAELVLLDPVLPLGFVGPRLRHRYGIVVHGAEVTVAAQARLGRLAMGEVLRGAELVIAAGRSPPRKRNGSRAARCRWSTCRRASTPIASSRSMAPPDSWHAAGSGCPTTPSWWRASAGSCPARGWTC